MRLRIISLLLETSLLFCCFARDLRTDLYRAVETATNRTLLSDVNLLSSLDMQETLMVLNNLTAAQKQVWEQQQQHEREIQARNRDEEEREKVRTKTLEQEQNMLKEIRAKVSRRFRALARKPSYNGHSGNGQGADLGAVLPKDCAAIYLDGEENSGVFRVWPTWVQDGKGFLVYCDMDTDEGGWTVIHRWVNTGLPRQYFVRSWSDYKDGFGDLSTAFWQGNEGIHQLTNQGAYELRFDFVKGEEKTFSKYRGFRIEGELEKFKLHVESYNENSTAGDILSSHAGANFSASDKNNLPTKTVVTYDRYGQEYEEIYQPTNCARSSTRGWWFQENCELAEKLKCHSQVPGNQDCQAVAEMKIRPTPYSPDESL